MFRLLRAPLGRLLDPLAGALLRAGVTPNMVTAAGTLAVVVASLGLLARGSLWVGALVIGVLAFTDSLDGTMARKRGGGSLWGAFLDSSLDRVGDGAVFGALVLWWAGDGDDLLLASLTLWCLVAGSVTSYVKARAEGLGLRADVGIAERTERLVLLLLTAGLGDLLNQRWITVAGVTLLAAASTVTVGQRLANVHGQAVGRALPPQPQPQPPQPQPPGRTT